MAERVALRVWCLPAGRKGAALVIILLDLGVRRVVGEGFRGLGEG